MREIWLRFLSGPDIDTLGLTDDEIVAAVEDVVAAHGRGQTVFEPRVHLVPDNGGAGHFNVLRGHLSGPGAVSGIKVVGDFHQNWQRGLPSEMGLLTLYDPETGAPRAVLDATLITACRTGAMTAVGARFLARPDSRVLGHAGSRGTAFWNVTLLDQLFGLDEIRVTSARPESREAFAEQLRAVTDTPVRVTGSVAEAFDGADILVEATRLTEPAPLLHPGLVRPGALVDHRSVLLHQEIGLAGERLGAAAVPVPPRGKRDRVGLDRLVQLLVGLPQGGGRAEAV